MIPLQIDRATSAPKSNATAGLTFAPAQSSTTDELFTGFLQRAADVASNPPASFDNASDSTSADSSAGASNATTGGASNGGNASPAPAKPSAASDNRQAPHALVAKQARSTTATDATTNFGGAKRSTDGANQKTAESPGDSKKSSDASSTPTDNSPANASPGETPVVAVPVDSVKTAAETPKKGSFASGGGKTAESTSSSAAPLATSGAAGRQTAGQTASEAARAAASATKPATNSAASGAAARQAAASQTTLPSDEKSTAIAPTRASRDATAVATGKSSVAVDKVDQNTASLAASDQANLPMAEANSSTTDLPSTMPLDSDAERAVQAALTAVAASATHAPTIVKEHTSHVSAATGDVGAVAGPTAAAGVAPTNSAGAFGDSAGDSTGSEGKAAASAAAGAKKTDGADNSGGVERVRFVQRVAKAFQTLGDQGGALRLRLSPPELGTLKLEVTVRSGKMNAQVETDTPEARDLIVNNLPALRERLNDLNIQVEQFDVNVAGESASNMSDQSSQDNAYRQTGARTTNNLRSAASGESGAVAGPSSASTPSGVNQLNVVV